MNLYIIGRFYPNRCAQSLSCHVCLEIDPSTGTYIITTVIDVKCHDIAMLLLFNTKGAVSDTTNHLNDNGKITEKNQNHMGANI